jgi:hypothetical protein
MVGALGLFINTGQGTHRRHFLALTVALLDVHLSHLPRGPPSVFSIDDGGHSQIISSDTSQVACQEGGFCYSCCSSFITMVNIQSIASSSHPSRQERETEGEATSHPTAVLAFPSHRIICKRTNTNCSLHQEYFSVSNPQGRTRINVANITRLSRGLCYGKIMDTHMEEPQL